MYQATPTHKHTSYFPSLFLSSHCPSLLFSPISQLFPSLSGSCCVEVTVHLVEGPSLSSLPEVLWRCVNVLGFLIRLSTQTGPKAEAAPLCLKLTHSLSPFLLSLTLFLFFLSLSLLSTVIPNSLSLFIYSVFTLSVTCTHIDVLFFSFQHNKPLYSFEDNADYVYDVMWSPVHPAMFAAVDGMGRLDLWNLNNDTEVRERVDWWVNIGHYGRIVCVMSLCELMCVYVCLVSSGPLAGPQPEPHNQTPKLFPSHHSPPPPPTPPNPSLHTHDSRFPCGRFPQALL